jgi:AraC-like DNA-binding protein
MKNSTNQFLGSHTLDIWLSGIFWVIIAILIYKVFEILKNGKFNLETFKFKYWFNQNFFSILLGVILSLAILRLGDYAFHLAEKFGYEFGETTDFVAWMIPISWFVQWRLEKFAKPVISKTIATDMHIHNNECKH